MKYYSLTEKGIELIPILVDLWVWGARFDPDSAVSPENLNKRLKTREQEIQRYVRMAKSEH